MEISEIKAQLSIKTVLEHYSLKADKNGMLCCPFHEDKTPSFQIFDKSNTFCCFSSNCSVGTGDQIQFIELKENKGKHQAILKAKELLNVIPKKLIPSVEKEDFETVFKKLKQNINSPKAKAYLTERGLEPLNIGYNATAYKNLKNCIVFPLVDYKNKVVSLYGRSINKGHFYTENRKGLFPKYPPAETKRLILTESIIDAQSLVTTSIKEDFEILALYGTNGLTKEHSEAIESLTNLEEIILFFDGDKAGLKATDKYSKELAKENLTISKINTPENEDINSLYLKYGVDCLLELIEESKTKEKEPLENELNTENPEYIIYQTKFLKLILLGGINLQQVDRLRVTILIERTPKLSPLHSIRQSGLDFYNDSLVEKFIRATAEKLEIGTSEIRLSIAELIEKVEAYRLSKMNEKSIKKPEQRTLTEERKQKALAYLKAPKLLERTNIDIGKSGMIGEEINRLLMYLVFTSRLREKPLNIICLGSSGTGKTHLQEKVAELIPNEQIIDATALSDNALYYFSRTALKHKLIVIEDMDGAENVLYQLRELMSKGHLSKQVVVRDVKGNMKTMKVYTEGPISVTGTTTQERIYEDNANRSLLLYLDGSKKHQEQIMDYQRSASAGKINHREEKEIKDFFKDMQTLLEPIRIINPYAEQLKIPQEVFKPLRSNAHYLQFIECVTFYHQHQRTVKTTDYGERYIETNLEDIKATNLLLKDVLLAKADELNGACRKFFEILKNHLKTEDKRSFYAKELRATMRISYPTLKRHLLQLYTNGYIKVVGGDKFRKGYEYEVVSYEEYKDLQSNIKTALDTALDKITKQVSSSVAQQ